jgi:ubiquinone/menaquinone biosynthesis C-methylase UbiE
MTIVLILLATVLLAALAYWELVVAEGVHLGRRVVALLYDLVAPRYDDIKQFTSSYEAWFLGEPLAAALREATLCTGIESSSSIGLRPLVLDVATGTGRLPLALFAQEDYFGHVVGLDSSRRMLTEAARMTRGWASRLTLIQQEASDLPFDDDTFDAVTCLEALEFMPDTRRALREMVRVLRPGGVMLLTNRVGPWAKFLVGHTQSRAAFEAMLAMLGLGQIQTQTWQVEYDLVWAKKPAATATRDPEPSLLAG